MLLTGAVLLLLAAAAWVNVVRQAATVGGKDMGAGVGDMAGMGGMGMVSPGGTGMISLTDATLFVAAWGVMMAAMMLPSALPMILLYRTVSRNLSRSGQHVIPTALFAATYLLVWLLFGVPVYAASAVVGALAGAAPGVAAWLPYALALTLVAAGAYQFTALKRVCLRYCQTPISFLMMRWRSGYVATVRLGLAHAIYCVGCCWGLMVVLVAAGAMSLPWVLLIAAIVFVEKLLPRGEWTAWAVGAALVALGITVAVDPALAVTLRGQMAMATPGMAGMPGM
jgi:predicted metal-binding membrane protein